jgi:cell wall-associated NlpC family hydrolase
MKGLVPGQARAHLLGGLAVLCMLAAGCAPFRPGLPSESAERRTRSDASGAIGPVLARNALALVGTPYRYGGNEPSTGFDCSGLVAYVHGQLGIAVPRTAAAQFAAAAPVERGQLQPGDLVFFRLVQGSREVSHVGVYTGAGRFVHAPQAGRNVVEAGLDDPYFRERFAGAGRFYAAGHGAGPRTDR